MAKTSGRLSADKAEEIIKTLSIKILRTLWFDKHGPVMDRLLSREMILDKLGIKTDKMNALELKGLDSMLGLSIHNLKKFAQKRKYNWIEITISDGENGKKHVYYGFTTDIDQIDRNVARMKNFVENWRRIAREAKSLGDVQKKQLS